ncbi:hypothetical protein SAMN05661080_01037 [Modestobacter sp. DSM 44400]|uniref:hypothetical protein n=1 Tax=Modestobacter sp. DSM 44400 TaxID=1550230 RepID=UPI0008950F8D|nr:hypothetical protein [Modestobacter sp. DSM 44400]SDX74835.1 hypothetical protein SAMN05661080_01037 [Modestobacter sp. DSM 44400]
MTDAVRDRDVVRAPLGRGDLPALVLASTGPDPLPWDTALAAVLGYARGRRPLRFRTPDDPQGRWFSVLAFGYERFDRQPVADGPLGDADVLVAEGLHGRLGPTRWAAVRATLDDVRPLAEAAVARAAGRACWELPAEEFSVLAEPGTVGAALREVWQRSQDADHLRPDLVSAALHHRFPTLVPHVDRTTRRQLWPHVVEGDSGVEAVVHRELRDNAAAFAVLETAVAAMLADSAGRAGPSLTRLRLHDVLLWLSGSLRLAHAVALGRATEEWRRYEVGGVH